MKSLCYYSLLLLSFVFIGCSKSEDHDAEIPVSNSTSPKWIVTKGKVMEQYSNKPIVGAKVTLTISNGVTKDTITDLNGKFSIGFYAPKTEMTYDIRITSDSVLENHQTGTKVPMYGYLYGVDKLSLSDLSGDWEFFIGSQSVVNVSLENLDGLNEEVNGHFIINGGSAVAYGPILSKNLAKEFFVLYGDSVRLKATIERANKPAVVIEKGFLSGPLKEQKLVLEYK